MNYIDRFITWKLDKGDIKSKESIKNYVSQLHTFERYLKEIHYTNFEEYGRAHVLKFMEDIEKGEPIFLEDKKPKKRAASTVLLYITLIQTFSKYINDVEGIKKNENIQTIKPTKPVAILQTEPKQLTKRQEVAIMGELERDAMYYTIARLMLDLGLRVSEVLNIEIRDYDATGSRMESRSLLVRGKGDKQRELKLPKETAKAIREWERVREEMIPEVIKRLEHRLIRRQIHSTHKDWEEKQKKLIKKIKEIQDYLFISREGGRLTVRAVQQKFKSIQMKFEKTHDLKQLNPHMFRHTCLKRMAIKGATPSDIVKISGHNSLDMVLRYTESTVDEAMKFLDSYDED
jgi:site-specific recombinase XerD